MFLVVKLADADGNYCENIALALIESLVYRFAGRAFHDYDYKNVAFAQFQKIRDSEARAEIM